MKLSEYVACEHYGTAHDATDEDPYQEGPAYERVGDDWTFFEFEYKGFSRNLWWFFCPGPHYKLWIGAQI